MTVLIHRHFLVLYNCGWREMQLFQIGANVAYQKKAMEKEKKNKKNLAVAFTGSAIPVAKRRKSSAVAYGKATVHLQKNENSSRSSRIVQYRADSPRQ